MSQVALGLTVIAPWFRNPLYLYWLPTVGLVITANVLPPAASVIVPVNAMLTWISSPLAAVATVLEPLEVMYFMFLLVKTKSPPEEDYPE